MLRSKNSVGRVFVALVVVTWCLTTGTASRADTKVYDKALRSTGLVVVPQENNGVSYGTCWLADREHKLVITNQHVVGEGAEALLYFPIFENGEVLTEYAAYRKKVAPIRGRIVASDARRDLALLQLDSLPDHLQEIPLAAKSARAGETVHSIGNSSVGRGQLWRYTTGTVRMVYSGKIQRSAGVYEGQVLETNAPVNQGDSGGPVVNDAGQLIGVVASYDPQARLVSNNVDVSMVRTFLQDGRERLKPSGLLARTLEVLNGSKPGSPTVVGNWKVNAITLDGEQRPGLCEFRSDGSLVLSFASAKGELTHKGWYGYANGVLVMTCPSFELGGRAHWVKNERFTLLCDGMLILDRQPAAEPVAATMPAK